MGPSAVASRPRSAGRAWLPAALEWLVYTALALYVVRGCWGRAVGQGVDMLGTLWFHEWLLHCVKNGVDPSWTSWFFHPHGFDLFVQNGNNFVDALVALPLRMLLGTPHHFCPLVLLLVLGNLLAMRALLRSLGLSRVAVVTGAVIFAFHPYLMLELDHGRVTQGLLWFFPLALRELLRMQHDPRWRRPLLAALFLALQAWTYWFSGFMVLLALGPALALAVVRGRKAWLRLGACAALTVALVLPGVIPMLARLAAGAVPLSRGNPLLDGQRPSLEHFENDAWSLLNLDDSLLQIPVEGLLLVALALLFCRRRLLWTTMLLLGMLLAAGPLPDGQGGQDNPLWYLARHLPGFTRLQFPYRFWAVMLVALAPAAAECVQRAQRGPWRRGLVALALVYLGLVTVDRPPLTLRGTKIPRPRYIEAVSGAPGVVLDLPLPCVNKVIHHQPQHGQPLVGGMAMGMVEYPPVKRLMRRMQSDRQLGAAVNISSGQTPQRPPGGAASFRWIVLHRGLYSDPDCLSALQIDGRPTPSPALLLQVERTMREFYGPPQVADRHALAWDLRRRP